MTSERVICSVLGLEAIERRRLTQREEESLERRVSAGLGGARRDAFIRMLIVALPLVAWMIETFVHDSDSSGGALIAGAVFVSCVGMMLFELLSMRDVGGRRILLTLLGACAALAFVSSIAVGEVVYWPILTALGFGTLAASLVFVGRAFEELPYWRSLESLAREHDPIVLVLEGIAALDRVPRRLRELGLTDGFVHRFLVIEGSFALIELDGHDVERFPRVPIARVHLVDRADETPIEETGQAADVRLSRRSLSEGELEELDRFRKRERARVGIVSGPIVFGTIHALHAVHAGAALGLSTLEHAPLPILVALLLGVAFAVAFAHLRVGREIRARTARVERRVGAKRGDPPIRETLLPSGRAWTEAGIPDAARLVPYD